MICALKTLARAAARFALAAVLVLVVIVAAVYTAFVPQGLWKLAWLPVVFVTVSGAVETWERLGKRRGGSTK